jgi:dUTP pyrophosphatase
VLEKFNKVYEQQLSVKTDDDILMPRRMHSTDAGLDLKAKKDYILRAHQRELVGTGVHVKIPEGYVGLLFPRSSLSKKGITMTNSVGVIDSDYRGEIMASLCYVRNDNNHLMQSQQHIDKYERIVQLVVVPISLVDPIKWEGTEEEWNDTVRGHGGFGSTGS